MVVELVDERDDVGARVGLRFFAADDDAGGGPRGQGQGEDDDAG